MIIIALSLAFSCSEEFVPTPYTYSKLFTGENNKTWQITLLEITLNGDVVSRFMEPCLRDDAFIFYANTEHSFEALSGANKCFSEPEPDQVVDSWSFNNATSALVMVIPRISDLALPYLVREADEEEMIVEIFFDQENTESVRVHFEATDEE